MRWWRLRRSLWIERVWCVRIKDNEIMHLISELKVDMIFAYIPNVVVTVHTHHFTSPAQTSQQIERKCAAPPCFYQTS